MDQVEEVKSKVDMVQLVSEYIPLKKGGRNYKGLCPFHGEKTPSFMVNPELQIWKCFGCGEGGDAYTFLQRMEGMEFGEALRTLAEKVGVKLTAYRPSQTEEVKERLVRVNSLAAEFYHYLLMQHRLGESARQYLRKRGIKEEVTEKFKLGFAPEGWDFLMKYLVGKKNFEVQDLERAGLVVKGQNFYDRFRNRVMFPLSNHRGQTVGFAGRVMPATSAEAAASQGAKYVNTPETEIYHKGELLYGLDVNKTEIKTAGWAVVVEGELDLLASYLAGVKNAVAVKGSALTTQQVDLVRRYAGTVVLALDADVAGDAAARRGIEVAERAGVVVKILNSKSEIINPKQYKDPGEWGVADPEGWRAAVGKAIPIYDYYLESAVARYGLDGVGKGKISRELAPIWVNISDEIVKAHYVRKLAEVLEVREEDVRAQLGKISSTGSQTTRDPSATVGMTIKTRREVVEEYVVGLALRNGMVGKLIGSSVSQWVEMPFWKKVVEQFSVLSPQFSGVKELIGALPAELRGRVEEQMLVEDRFEEGDPEREWEKAVRELEEIEVRERIEKMREEAQGRGELRGLTKRLAELTKDK